MLQLKWESYIAKNGENALMLNGYQLYSKYKPKESAFNWIQSEVDENAEEYILIGLGLGYHLEYLLTYASNKKIYVYYFDEIELRFFEEKGNSELIQLENVKLIKKVTGINMDENIQILIPNAWIKAIGETHPLNNILEIIKINQMSYNRAKKLMYSNFEFNRLNESEIIENSNHHKIGCLLAAGPSLDQTVLWLKEHQGAVDIFVVGAALKTVLTYGISPTGVIISDASDLIQKQFEGLKYEGPLYYLCTANTTTVNSLKGRKYILFQKGFSPAENEAFKRKSPILDTGGSVGTVTFSLMEQLGYETIVLFGQDLGFPNNKTHSEMSSSNVKMNEKDIKRKIKANDGSMISTNLMLYSFWNWYEEKCKQSNLKVYNTAVQGAKISNVELINEDKFRQLIKENLEENGDFK